MFFFFFNDTATTEIYTLSLHDALPIFPDPAFTLIQLPEGTLREFAAPGVLLLSPRRSEEHTSELQSQSNLVCRLLLEKKKRLLASDVLAWQSISFYYHSETSLAA